MARSGHAKLPESAPRPPVSGSFVCGAMEEVPGDSEYGE